MSRGVLDAFEPTFDEIIHAALVIHVVDPTVREWRAKKEEVDRLLAACEVMPERVVTLYSKRDLLNGNLPEGGDLCYAAHNREDIRRLKKFLFDRLFGDV